MKNYKQFKTQRPQKYSKSETESNPTCKTLSGWRDKESQISSKISEKSKAN